MEPSWSRVVNQIFHRIKGCHVPCLLPRVFLQHLHDQGLIFVIAARLADVPFWELAFLPKVNIASWGCATLKAREGVRKPCSSAWIVDNPEGVFLPHTLYGAGWVYSVTLLQPISPSTFSCLLWKLFPNPPLHPRVYLLRNTGWRVRT